MIALIGLPGNGKTYTIKLLKKEGYSVLIADEFFHEQYKVGNEAYELIKKHLGSSFVNKKGVDRSKLRDYAIDNMDTLEKLVHPILEQHLLKHKYDFVEIPIINSKHVNFYKLFSQVINITYHSNSHASNSKLDQLIIERQKNTLNKGDVIQIESGDIAKLKSLIKSNLISF